MNEKEAGVGPSLKNVCSCFTHSLEVPAPLGVLRDYAEALFCRSEKSPKSLKAKNRRSIYKKRKITEVNKTPDKLTRLG